MTWVDGGQSRGHDGRAAQQPTPTDRSHDDVEVSDICEQFQRRGALPGDDTGIVVGVDERRTGLVYDARVLPHALPGSEHNTRCCPRTQPPPLSSPPARCLA